MYCVGRCSRLILNIFLLVDVLTDEILVKIFSCFKFLRSRREYSFNLNYNTDSLSENIEVILYICSVINRRHFSFRRQYIALSHIQNWFSLIRHGMFY